MQASVLGSCRHSLHAWRASAPAAWQAPAQRLRWHHLAQAVTAARDASSTTSSGSARPVLVTGACGNLGGKIISRLVSQGRHVLATDRAPAPADPAAAWGASSADYVEFVQADLTNMKALEELACGSGSVVHVGAIPGPSEQPPPGVDPAWSVKAPIGLEKISGLDLLMQNLLGSCALFEAVARRQDGSRVVFSSSLFAMGWSHNPADFRPRYLPVDEDHGALPLEHYGLSKSLSEEFAGMLARVGNEEADNPARETAPSFVSLRFSNIVKADKWAQLPWMTQLDNLTPLMWAYCHEDDVVDAHILALDVPQADLPSRCESFLIVADDTRIARPTEELVSRQWSSSSTAPLLRHALPDFASIVSNKKAKRLLGFKPRSFRDKELPVKGSPGDESINSWLQFEAPKDFELKSGERLSGGYITYKTHGVLNDDRSNVILHPTSFDATHWELEFQIGPGKALDTNKYFVIVVDMLGNGVSMSPSNCGRQFPKNGTTMCDNVRLQAMLLDSMGIDSIAMIYGYSMGAMQALHWAVMFPERVERVAAVCGSAQAKDFNIVFLDSLRHAMLLDPDCAEDLEGRLVLSGNCEQGLRAFARIYAGWGMSMEFYRQELWRTSSRDGQPFTSREDFVVRSYEGGFAQSHPLNLLAQLHTWKTGDVSQAHGLPPDRSLQEALGRIQARVYLMPSTTDTYFTVPEIAEEAKFIPKCSLLPIESAWGHRAGDPHRPGQEADAQLIAQRVAELLAEA